MLRTRRLEPKSIACFTIFLTMVDMLQRNGHYRLHMCLSQCFSTFFKSRNLSKIYYHFAELNAPYSTIQSIFMDPSKKLAEPRLKNAGLRVIVISDFKMGL